MTMRVLGRVGALVVGGVLLVSGCGDDDTGGDPVPTPTDDGTGDTEEQTDGGTKDSEGGGAGTSEEGGGY